MRVINDRVLLKPYRREEIRHGSIVVPTLASEPIWEVVDVGDKVQHVKPGDKVIAPVHVLQEISVGGQDYAVIREDHIYAILEGDEV